MFDDKSRYKDAQTYQRIDRRGRTASVTATPQASEENFIGYHLRIQGQRLDHMAYRYLNNSTGFWRICDLNDVMLPEALSEALEIAIPGKKKQ
jgi:hypothetical protein